MALYIWRDGGLMCIDYKPSESFVKLVPTYFLLIKIHDIGYTVECIGMRLPP